MLNELTPQQRIAATDRGGKLLVSAAAGSGKTKVLVERLLCYLTDMSAPAQLDDFLIITYTKAAASELRGKIGAELTSRIAAEPENRHLQKQLQRLYLTQISTVHGFCTQILREYAYRLDIAPDFRVADETESGELRRTVLSDTLDRAYEELGEDPDFRTFADTQGLGRDDRGLPELIFKVFDSARCHLDPEMWLDQCVSSAQPGAGTDVSGTAWGQYLLADLKLFLDGHIQAFSKCLEEADQVPEFEKVSQNLSATILQLTDLRQSESWDDAVRRLDVDFGTLRFPRKNPDQELTDRIKAVRDACKEGLKKKQRGFAGNSRELLEDMANVSPAVRGLIHLVRQFSDDYSHAKRSRRILDFGDLEHRTLDLLMGKRRAGATAAAREIAQRYREVLVDEYQDSNAVQDAIFSILTAERRNCFLVGDVKQSIYRFRLADPGIFLEKYKRYDEISSASPGPERKVLLSHNFRSGGEVIAAVNDVFSVCMCPTVGGLQYTDAEALREGVPHIALPDPGVELYALETDEDSYGEEAAFVACRLKEMIGKTMIRSGDSLRPMEAEDAVILLRSPGSVGSEFQRALEAEGIRCVIGGGMDLLQTQEVENLRNLLRTVANPRQDIPLVSTLASPTFGFTAEDLAQIRSGRIKGSFYDALIASHTEKAEAFLTVLEVLRQEARRGTLTSLINKCFSLTRMDSLYAAMPGGEAKKENLRQFFQFSAGYEAGGVRSLGQFLEHLDNLQTSGVPAASGGGSGCVTIMSIHRSKGLEFPVVFLCGLARKFNREDLREQVLCDPELGLGLNVADTGLRVRYPSLARRAIAAKTERESVSEELRVLYVAMTRARDRLVMTFATKRLESKLREIACRLPMDGGAALCREADCPGDWVLTAVMGRTDAGELHALGGNPGQTRFDGHPWTIRVCQGIRQERDGTVLKEDSAPLPPDSEELLRRGLSFQYPHAEATRAPSKQTATGKKGREKDEEAAEDTRAKSFYPRPYRRPSFLGGSADSLTRGSAIHAAMQYLRSECCTGEAGVAGEVARLVESGFLTPDQGALVDCCQIAAFFETPIGKKLRSGAKCLREFKFSILEPGEEFGPGLAGEQVLMQGVVDCALLEEDGIVVLDFKTDRVTDETICAVAERYRSQVETYAAALERIYKTPVRENYLYFFSLNRFVKL